MKRIILIAMLCLSVASYSQAVFKPGFFTDKAGHKTACYIKYTIQPNNPSSFEYKMNIEDDKTNILTLQNTSIVEITDEVKFVNKTIQMDRSSEKINTDDYNKELVLQTETHFLKYLVEGEFSLLVYRENQLDKYFYMHNSEQVYQLGYKVYLSDDRSFLQKNEMYKRQLWDSVKCTIPNKKTIDRLAYKESDLKDYFYKINECKTGVKPKEAKEHSGIVNLKAVVLFNMLKMKNPDEEFQFGTQNNTSFTGQFEYVFPSFNYKWSVFVEPHFLKFSKTVPYNNVNHYVLFYDNNVVIDFKVFQIPIGITYKVFKKENYNFFVSYAYTAYNSSKSNYYIYDVRPQYKWAQDKIQFPNNSNITIGGAFKNLELLFTFAPFSKKQDLMLTGSSLGLRYTVLSNKKKEKQSK